MIFSVLLEIIRAPIVWLFDKFMPSREDSKREAIAREHKKNRDDIEKFLKGD